MLRRVARSHRTPESWFIGHASCAQCYLRDTAARLEADVGRAAREGWHFGAKTVRGAYLVFERARAAARGADSPVHATLQDTHANYDRRAARFSSPEVA